MYQKVTKNFDQSKCNCSFDIIDLKVNTGDNMYICLSYRGCVYFEAMRPELIKQALMYLK